MSSSLDPFLEPYSWQNILYSVLVVAAFSLLAIVKNPLVVSLGFSVQARVSAFARRKGLAIFVLFFAVAALRVALLPLLTVPLPGIHDEFSYLLMGDTFAHGRLTNPSHPMWRSFETFHVNWLPTYSSIYPPAQGLVLALGQLLGSPWIGVLFSAAAMCAAILWMLQGWLPPKWALLGAILAWLKLGIASYWMNSYWSGAMGAIGGALVLGAIPRIRRFREGQNANARSDSGGGVLARHALLLAAGIAILANSRPYEGVLLCIPVAAWLVWWLSGKIPSPMPLRIRLREVLLPIAAVLVCTACAMAFYNYRTTGKPLLFPYTLNLRTYVTAPIFLWQHAKPALHYGNQQFEDFYNEWERTDYQQTTASVRAVSLLKLVRLNSVFLWPAAILLLPGFVMVFRDRGVRFLLVVFLLVLPGIFVAVWSNPHYASPLTCAIFALLVQSIRHLWAWRISGRPLGAAVASAAVLLLVLQVAGDVHQRKCDEMSWTCGGNSSREALQKRLEHLAGKHLIIVRYEADHNIHDEWVFNGADIEGAKVLWARELDPEQNAALVRYFHERSIWLVDPEVDNLELIPYRDAAPPASNTAH
ncbi:MAG TPA: hypothetical protein VE545_06715 [Candidatus Dormibacteraeota bacterium]|nr:hypothetical protein [Candidatus Dormibacteraeota bacterium]